MTFEEIIASPQARQVAQMVVAVVIIGLVARMASMAAANKIEDADLRYRVRKAIAFGSYAAIILAVLVTIGGQFGSLTVILGAASVGIGFALQEVIVSVAGWIAISFGGFYKTGDRVLLGGIVGDVIDIGILRTTLMECGGWVKGDQYNGRIVLVANSFIFKEPVFNYSGDFRFLWDEITVPIKYDSDRKLMREILLRVAGQVVGDTAAQAKDEWASLVKRYRIENASLDPMVMAIANDNWVEFHLRYVVDHRTRRTTKDQLFMRILDEIDASGGRIGVASATFHLVESTPLRIQLENAPGKASDAS